MASPEPNKPKIAVLTNMVPPYRLALYRSLARHFRLFILCSGHEHNRPGWESTSDALPPGTVKRTWGVTLRRPIRANGRVYDYRFLHLNPGYLADLLRVRPDGVLASELGLRTVIALVYCSMCRIPLWVSWEGTLHTERKIGFARRLLRRLLVPRIEHWISCGQTSTEYLQALGVVRQRIVEAQCYHDEQPFVGPAAPALQPPVRPAVLYVGQLIERKGVGLLLSAAAALQAEGLAFSLLLVGDGPEKAALQQLARTQGLQHVEFIPSVPPDRLLAVYRSADVFVFPTLEDVWGVVVNEALWAGLPVLASIYAGCARELLPPENTFDPLDAVEFGAKLRQAIRGELKQPDRSRLKPSAEVSESVAAALREGLRTAQEAP